MAKHITATIYTKENQPTGRQSNEETRVHVLIEPQPRPGHDLPPRASDALAVVLTVNQWGSVWLEACGAQFGSRRNLYAARITCDYDAPNGLGSIEGIDPAAAPAAITLTTEQAAAIRLILEEVRMGGGGDHNGRAHTRITQSQLAIDSAPGLLAAFGIEPAAD